VGVAFARPLVLLHSAPGTRRSGNRFGQTRSSLLFTRHLNIISSCPVVVDAAGIRKVISDQ
jgi:hypothetical protein